MAATPPSSVDVEMVDALSPASTLSPPPDSGSEYEDVKTKKDSPNPQITSLEKINLESPLTGTDLANMARRSARNTNKPRPVVVSPARPAKRKIVTKVSAAKKAPKWTAEKLLTDTKSPLASADLRTILCQPAAWDILTPAERAEIIALFPAGTRILDEGTENARPDLDALRNDNNFRHDCATYTDNIAQGKHDPEWLEQAWAARERRRMGDFDDYLVQKFEDEWSCELPEDFKPRRDAPAPAESVEEGKEAAVAAGEMEVQPLLAEAGEETEVAKQESIQDDSKDDLIKDTTEMAKDDAEGGLNPKPDAGEGASGNEPVVKLGSPVPDDDEVVGTKNNTTEATAAVANVLSKVLRQSCESSSLEPRQIAKAKIILLSFATLKRPRDVDVVIKARGKNLKSLRAEILSHYPKPDPSAAKGAPPSQKTIILVDSVNDLATAAPQMVPTFLSSIIMPSVSLVAVYHTDVPLVLPRTVSEYEPHPLTVLSHLATSILRLSSLRQEIERQKARNRSIQEPEWGLREEREGVLIGLKGETKSEDYRGVVVEMEVRRRSGRAMAEKFVLLPLAGPASSAAPGKGSKVFLLSEHPVFATPDSAGAYGGAEEEEEPESTFNLGLTEKQRRDREGIVLPYFDAQTDIGAGEGGRILYEMGREDDFDDEEDEI
ncbi:histone acetylation protein 2 [Colletotrichum sp. SAR11_59]|nr:histone acetylation protein 2 [Colletotrichum sp. SAR11_59]